MALNMPFGKDIKRSITYKLISGCISADVVGVVIEYLMPEDAKNPYSIGMSGFAELCENLPLHHRESGFFGACMGDHREIVYLFFAMGYVNWNHGLDYASSHGYIEMALDMINRGADNLNLGLSNACQNGHTKLAYQMIYKGATDLNLGLYSACKSGNLETIELMLEKGATKFKKHLG